MKELGEKLSELRKKNGVALPEASHDLGINEIELESLENGNFKAFKDVYELKNIVKSYAKYLGLDENSILDEFNDFVFEKTSKISLDDIKKSLKKKEEVKEEKIHSPYTKIKPTRYDFAPIVLLIVLLVFISLMVYLFLLFFKPDKEVDRELKVDERMVMVYEFTE